MSEFNTGYGQCRADIVEEIKKAMRLLGREIHSTDPVLRPTEEQKKEMIRKWESLRWVLTIVKAQKSPR